MDTKALADQLNAKYATYDVDIDPEDLVLIDGGWTIDGMDPDEWVHAVYVGG